MLPVLTAYTVRGNESPELFDFCHTEVVRRGRFIAPQFAVRQRLFRRAQAGSRARRTCTIHGCDVARDTWSAASIATQTRIFHQRTSQSVPRRVVASRVDGTLCNHRASDWPSRSRVGFEGICSCSRTLTSSTHPVERGYTVSRMLHGMRAHVARRLLAFSLPFGRTRRQGAPIRATSCCVSGAVL